MRGVAFWLVTGASVAITVFWVLYTIVLVLAFLPGGEFAP